METRIGLFSARASASAALPQGRQCTGLPACWRRYGEVSRPSRFSDAAIVRFPARVVNQTWGPPGAMPPGIAGPETDTENRGHTASERMTVLGGGSPVLLHCLVRF